MAEKEMEAAVKITVMGRVQGVGFRYFILQKAQEMRLRGYTVNTGNGEVDIHAEGDKIYLEDLVKAVSRGPSSAKVSDVIVNWLEKPTNRFRTFEIKR